MFTPQKNNQQFHQIVSLKKKIKTWDHTLLGLGLLL